MSSHLLRDNAVVQAQLRNDIPEFAVGSVVDVHYKIQEGNKERIQIFSGIVINRHGGNTIDATFTVLKVATASIKVERTFPLHSPMIAQIVVKNKQRARRANLRYLHDVKDPIKSVRTKEIKAKKLPEKVTV